MSRNLSPRASVNPVRSHITARTVRIAALAAALTFSGVAAHASNPPGHPTPGNPAPGHPTPGGSTVAASMINPDGSPAVRPPDTAAIVDGHTITLSQVTDLAMRADGANITSRLIDNYLVDQECKKRGITVPQSLIDDSVQGLANLIAGQGQTLEQGLAEHHETLAQLQDEMKESLERELLVEDKVQPTRMVHCKAILVRFTGPNIQQPPGYTPHTDAEAQAIIADIQKQLKAGKDFGDLANQYSEDQFSKGKGGEVGFAFDGAPLDQDLVRAAMKLKKGEISDPVKVSYGYYLIQVVSTSDSHPADEDSSYAAAEDKYRRQQAEYLVPDYLKKLRAQAKIVNYIP